jgi:hypothetical protein
MESRWHWSCAPAPSTRKLVDGATFEPTEKGLRVVLEVTAYPGGQVQVTTSRVSGRPRQRTIVQSGDALMFNVMDEAKDAVDLILDRLADEADAAMYAP